MKFQEKLARLSHIHHKISDDTKQRIQAILSLVLEASKILIAALLVVFVPQKCPENADGLCTFRDNFADLTNYNLFVLIFNFATLGAFLFLYRVEYRREEWYIKYLDIDPTRPNNYLKQELNQYPTIDGEMLHLNHKYLRWSRLTLVLYTMNSIFSAVLIYAYYYLDYRSITVLLTNIVLVADKLYNAISTSMRSVHEEIACSAYLKTQIIFNRVDEDYRHHDNFERDLENNTQTNERNGIEFIEVHIPDNIAEQNPNNNEMKQRNSQEYEEN
jgi:hypothetical protein